MTDRTGTGGLPGHWSSLTLGRGWKRGEGAHFKQPVQTATQREERRLHIIEILFQIFLILIMVHITSGAADSEDARALREAATASGDAVKQGLYFLSFLLFGGFWVRLRGLRLPRSLSVMQYVLLGWILLSSTWAVDHAVSIRRGVLMMFIFATIGMAVDLLGSRRSMACLYRMLALCVTLSLIAVPLFPFAVHPPTETDASIIGGWRGIFIHKNTAGAICAVSSIIFLHFFINRRRWYDLLFFLVCIVFLVGSKSKTPLGFLPIAISLSLLYRVMFIRASGRIFFYLTLFLIIASLILSFYAYQTAVDAIFNDPLAFTGRMTVWASAGRFIRDHVWFGAGYSALWATNLPPPILAYTKEPFEEFIVHSHNGYLETMGTLGLPGLVMAVTAAFIIPFSQIFRDKRLEFVGFNAMIGGILLFCMLENLLESQLYSRDREIWVCLFIAILALQMNFRSRGDAPSVNEADYAAGLAPRVSRRGWHRSIQS